ncbi:GNAT family N-acetyltransferase [Flagellimonas sp. 389]|uniref:GNAT family N-acetyltransferase n=1 Tax=Flagellimonas sp. 389 TaxID=2835862 RepID=UPI001BD5589F|nr:GNAT family N-acetyltransferase [Flagellimonas sp. 389]MBS9462952.1 GNAT family N-acetyltransferase [Flagellimonas sp. 389]
MEQLEKPDNMHIIEAKKEDAAYIALLARFTFTETFGHYFNNKKDLQDYLSRTFNVPKLRVSLNKPNNVFWLAYVDDLPAGYAKLKLHSPSKFINSQNVSQLQKIYVLKDFLSVGVGRELQNKVLERAAANNSENIWLSVLKSNTRAITFYEKNDFDKIGNHDFQIGKELFEFQAMAKNLI